MSIPLLVGSHAPNLDIFNHTDGFLPDRFRFSPGWTKRGEEMAVRVSPLTERTR